MVNEDDDNKKVARPLSPKHKLAAVVLFLAGIYLVSSSGSSGANGFTDDDDNALGDVDIIESDSKLGWDENAPPPVQKRVPRECAIKRIDPQVFNPLVYNTKNKKGWKRRAYTCGRKGSCRSVLTDDFEDRRWKKISKGMDATFVVTDGKTVEMLRNRSKEKFTKLYFEREGMTYLDTILGAFELDGNIVEQFNLRRSFVKQYGCSINALKLMTNAYRVDLPEDCARYQKVVAKNNRVSFVRYDFNPATGDISDGKVTNAPVDCESLATGDGGKQVLLKKTMPSPLLLRKKLFNVRSYMLVGSTMPFMVFFRRGWIRRSIGDAKSKSEYTGKVSLDGDPLSLDKFQEHLAFSKIAGAHYVDTFLQSSTKKIAQFVFHSVRRQMKRRRGSYQLVALDFVIDEAFHVYLESTTSYPALRPSGSFDMAGMVAEMHDLVQELQEVPVALETMVPGDKYGEWEMIFSELHESCTRIAYNPCHSFYEFNNFDLKKANVKVAKVHNTETRHRHAVVDRINKKTEENKKNMCRLKRLSYPGKACDKLHQAQDEEEFRKQFLEHEKSFNPNDFRFRQPGEIMAWDSVA